MYLATMEVSFLTPAILTPKGATSLRRHLADPESSVSVHPARWQTSRYANLRPYQSALAVLPLRMTTPDLFAIRATGDVRRLFLWTMAWGFGGDRQAYGPWRTDRMLGPVDADTRLKHLVELAATKTPGDAFYALHNTCRLPWLGTAFGSKVLYAAGFMHTPHPLQRLVLDAMVTRAFKRRDVLTALGSALFTGVKAGTRDPEVYEDYIRGVYELRDRHALGFTSDRVERWLWAVGAGQAQI